MTPNAELAFSNPHVNLSVRAFAVKDGLSRPFDCHVTAGSTSADLDLDLVVGHPAALRIATGDPEQPYAVWSGLVSEIEQIAIEESGLSVYALRIVPMLWRCKQRRNHRVFQHLSVPEIARTLLAEWQIDVVFRLDEKLFPRHEYRVQYGESDLAFISRLLEEEGIAYLLEQVDPDGNEKDENEPEEEQDLPSMHLVLTEAPAQTGKRFEAPFPYMGHTDDSSGAPYVTKVRVGRSVRPGRFTLGSYDYRSSAELRLLAEAKAGHELEERYESFRYIPGAFLTEPRPEAEGETTPLADRARGPGAEVDEELGLRQARIGLERCRSQQRQLVMKTNQLVLAPGVTFVLDCHPRPDITNETGILVIAREIVGEHDGEWHSELSAAFAADAFRPAAVTPKPRVMGVQSALVVGPEGEEIYCDALGRVRVQFFWDRYGQRDQDSSCWIRVSQAWAGSGYGMSAIPRVGHEVLVDFLEGDPDLPIIVGRAHQRGAVPPDQLPLFKTKTTWRSSSSPGGDGFNEISMNDARGEEKLYLRAQKDMNTVVLNNKEDAVGADLTTHVRGNEKHDVGRNQELHVLADRTVMVDGNHSIKGTRSLQVQAGRTTGLSCSGNKLVLSNGEASLVFDGPNIYLESEGSIRINAGRITDIHGKQINIEGRPEVYINTGETLTPRPQPLPMVSHEASTQVPEEGGNDTVNYAGDVAPDAPGGLAEAEFDGKGHLLHLINEQFGTKLKWPNAVVLPPEWDEQLERLGRIANKGGIVKGKLMDPETWQAMKDRLNRRLAAEKARLNRIGSEVGRIFKDARGHYGDSLTRLTERLSLEKGNLAQLKSDLGDVFSGKHGNFIDSAKALAEIGKEQWKNIKALKKDLTAMFDAEVEYFNNVKEQVKGVANEVKAVIEDFKDLVNNPKDAMLDIVFGEDKELAEDITSLADEFGYGDEVGDFLGVDDGAGDVVDGVDDAVDDIVSGGNGGPGFDKSKFKRYPNHLIKEAAGPRIKANVIGKNSGVHQSIKNAAGPRIKTNAGMSKGIHSQLGAAGSRRGVGGGVINPAGAKRGMAGGMNLGGMQQLSGSAEGLEGLAGGPGGAASRGQAMAGGALGGDPLTAGSNHADFMTRTSGFGAEDVAKTVSQQGPTVLQSPADGQILVVPKEGANLVDPSKLSNLMVDAQMEGKAVDGAIASALENQGYAVYKRGWGDWTGPFVEAGKSAAATV